MAAWLRKEEDTPANKIDAEGERERKSARERKGVSEREREREQRNKNKSPARRMTDREKVQCQSL